MEPIKVNTEIIKALNPCQDRLDNWEKHYNDFNDDLHSFLSLDKITAADKIWVAVRLMPRDLVEVFAIDCAIYAAADVSYEPYAIETNVNAIAADADADAYAAADALAYVVSYAASYASDSLVPDADNRENQVDCLIYLITEVN
jgi:hypothetical protein